MCGVFGSVNINQINFAENALSSIKHRGPDHQDFIKDNNVTLGMTRLSIIDLDTGNQPITNENEDIFLVCNGEIYNYLEIRNEIKDKVNFKTNSDVECILKLYELYSFDCVKKLRGMFSFAIYDAKKSLIFIARDRFGIKPLYYYFDKNSFIFASEIKSILEYSNLNPTINLKKMFPHNYFWMNLETHINEIKELEPGTYGVLNTNNDLNFEVSKYWSLETNSTLTDEKEIIEKLEFFLDESCSIHLRSDVPINMLLSGGVDSNILAYFVKKNYDKKFNSYTFGNSKKGLNEFESSNFTANEIFKSNQNNIFLNFDRIFSTFPKVMRHLEVSCAKNLESSLASYFLMEGVKKHNKSNKVVLCGEGADELFGGYKWFFSNKSRDMLAKEYSRHHKEGLYRLQLKRVDKMSMAHSIEARVPFLDHIFFEFASKIDVGLRSKNDQIKYILRKTAEKFLPSDIAWMPKAQHTTGTGITKYISDWLGTISHKSLNNLPLKNFPKAKEKIWNQSHSDENFEKYNAIVSNLFYFTFIKKKKINYLDDIFKF